MKTKTEILDRMCREMPYALPAHLEPYIKEAMEIYARVCCEESLEKAAKNIAHGPIEGRELEATEILVIQPKNIVLL